MPLVRLFMLRDSFWSYGSLRTLPKLLSLCVMSKLSWAMCCDPSKSTRFKIFKRWKLAVLVKMLIKIHQFTRVIITSLNVFFKRNIFSMFFEEFYSLCQITTRHLSDSEINLGKMFLVGKTNFMYWYFFNYHYFSSIDTNLIAVIFFT